MSIPLKIAAARAANVLAFHEGLGDHRQMNVFAPSADNIPVLTLGDLRALSELANDIVRCAGLFTEDDLAKAIGGKR